MSSTSYAQLFVHMTTFEFSFIWSKSILNTRCRICRRKADPESMLLCDGCDRGHHLYCLKPKLKKIPSGDWFCHECKPKERVKSPKKKTRRRLPRPTPLTTRPLRTGTRIKNRKKNRKRPHPDALKSPNAAWSYLPKRRPKKNNKPPPLLPVKK